MPKLFPFDDVVQLERTLGRAVEACVRAHGSHGVVQSGVLVRETASTQDAARAHAKPGVVVVAGRQTAGRGRLGRTWHDAHGHGIAATFTLDATRFSSGRLALIGAVAALHCVRDCMIDTSAEIGLRWPNDVVERVSVSGGEGGAVGVGAFAPGRKIAGVLVDTSGDLACMGIGINVLQESRQWPAELAGSAVSLRELGSGADRALVVHALVTRVAWAARLSDDTLVREFSAADTLMGSRHTFEHDARVVEGVVARIDPLVALHIRTDDGGVVALPAMSTSLLSKHAHVAHADSGGRRGAPGT
jgi:BirA family biotin operon repressor/biotin-[acetyl-CoA-carboxylase] ligase